MKLHYFDLFDPICDIGFLCDFKLACDTNGIQEVTVMFLFHLFYEGVYVLDHVYAAGIKAQNQNKSNRGKQDHHTNGISTNCQLFAA